LGLEQDIPTMSGTTPPVSKSWPLRSLILFSALALLALVIGVTVVARALTDSFSQLEHSATQQKSEQVYRAFEADLRQLFISNRDYAEWDDAEQFVHARDPQFVKGNFSAETLLAMHVDLVWIVDAKGRELFSALVDRGNRSTLTPAPAAVVEQFRRFQTTDRALRERSPAERTIRTRRGLAAVSAVEISRSDYSGATGATMLFARFMESEDVARVQETSHLPVRMVMLADVALNPALLPQDVTSWAAQGRTANLIRVETDDAITGYALVRDVDSNPVAVFATTGSRDVFALGSRTTWYLLACIVALSIVFGVLALGLVWRMLALQAREFAHRLEVETQERDNQRNLVRQAERDLLTGLPNRAYLQARMPRLLKALAGGDRLLALIYVDIDHFKNVNDSRGHACGDQLLQVVAQRLRASVSSHDVVARTGGDEFVIVASLLPDMATVERLAERLHAAVSGSMEIDSRSVNITASLGIAVCPQDGTDIEALFKHADIALFQAKDAGRNCHKFFSSDMNLRIVEHAELTQALREAVAAGDLYMEYQPIVDMVDGHLTSLEALMRWRHVEMGQVSPERFIPVAEESGLIVELGEFALRAVLAQLRQWLDAGMQVVPIAVNVSPLQFERQDFAALVKRLTAEAGVAPKWVRFEITESAMMREPEKLVGALRALRELGSMVLIDDFGTGYSSLSYLDRLPVDTLKIDRAFVRDMSKAAGQSPIVEAVIEMARNLRLSIVAEGVETLEQADMLRAAGCDFAQGYVYSRPVSAANCGEMLRKLHGSNHIADSAVARILKAG
jgi:diguanylate cyclase (GGDEF)-like protein